MMWIMPYRTVENMIDGVVVTFVNIGRIKRVEGAVEAIKQTSTTSYRTAREPLVMLDQQLRVVSANEPFCRARRGRTGGDRRPDDLRGWPAAWTPRPCGDCSTTWPAGRATSRIFA